MGVKNHADDAVLRVDWLILADAKCRAEKLTSSHNRFVAHATIYTHWKSAFRSSRMEPSTNLFNFNNAAVARATICTKWKCTLTTYASAASTSRSTELFILP